MQRVEADGAAATKCERLSDFQRRGFAPVLMRRSPAGKPRRPAHVDPQRIGTMNNVPTAGPEFCRTTPGPYADT
jgi:hypothetical protein